MRVRATQMGYYQDRRVRKGQVFDLVPIKITEGKGKTAKVKILTPEAQFTDKWLEKIEVSGKKNKAKQIEEDQGGDLNGPGEQSGSSNGLGDDDVI